MCLAPFRCQLRDDFLATQIIFMSLIKARRMVVTVSHLRCLPRLVCSEPFSNRRTSFALPKIARRWWS